MKLREVPIHPTLFALQPPLALYAANVSLVPVSDVWLPCLCSAGVALALWGLVRVFLREWGRAAGVASALVFCAFWYGQVADWTAPLAETYASGSERTVAIVAWAVPTLGLAVLAGRKWRAPQRLTLALNLLSGLAVAFALATAVMAHWSAASRIERAHRSLAVGQQASAKDRPDVFYIVLDGFGRGDVLAKKYGMPEIGLEEGLERRGFFVARDARANYVQTELSIASALNMSEVQSLVEPTGTTDEQRMVLDRLIGDSAVARTFKSLGYTVIAVTSGFPALTFSGADLVVGGDLGSTLYLDALLKRTPFSMPGGAVESQFDQRRRLVSGAFTNIERLAPASEAPRFVIVHVLAPHPPFVFGAGGEAVRPRGGFSIEDGSHFVANHGADAYRAGYRDQALFIGERLLQAVDRLIEEQPGAVVVVASDHGPKMGLDQESLDGTDVNECFPILLAVWGPDSVTERLHASSTPVNLFRAVLSGLFSTELPNTQERSYYSPWSSPLEFVDVTDRVDERAD
jgi:hypothetical protein